MDVPFWTAPLMLRNKDLLEIETISLQLWFPSFVYKKDKFWPDPSLILNYSNLFITTSINKMAILRNSLIATALTLLFSASTNAHVALNPKFAEPGQNLTTAFHVPHGCNGSATTGIMVTVPDVITVLTPQQVNNWVR